MNETQPNIGQGTQPTQTQQPLMQSQNTPEKTKGKYGMVNITLTIANIILVMFVAWLVMDLSGVGQVAAKEAPTNQGITIPTLGTLSVQSLYFTIIDLNNIYSMQDTPIFCYNITGFYNSNELASPIINYKILDSWNKEVKNKVLVDKLRNYQTAFSGCETIEEPLTEGVYTLKIVGQDQFSGDYAKKQKTFRITQYPRNIIYTNFKEHMADELTVSYTHLVDTMNADNEMVKKDDKYGIGQPIVLESEITTFSKAQFDGKQRAWIIQKIQMVDENGVLVYQSDNQDLMTDIAGDKLTITAIIDTTNVKPGKYTILINYEDLYSFANKDATPIEVEIV